MEPNPIPDEKLEKQKAAVIHFFYWSIIIGGGYLAVKYLLPAFMPFIIAFLIAWMLDRPITWLSKKAHLPRGLAAILLILLFAVAATGLITLAGAGIVTVIKRGMGILPGIFSESILPALEYFFDNLEQLAGSIDPMAGSTLSSSMDNVYQLLSDGAVKASGAVLSALGGMLTHVPSAVAKAVITMILTTFISMDFATVRRFLSRMIPAGVKPVLRECGSFFGQALPKCLLSYLMILCITACELSIGLLILRIPNALTIALVTSLLDILPVLGTGTVLIPWAIFHLLQDDLFTGIGLLVLYAVIALIRNFIEPHLVGRQIELHPVLTFTGMLLGVRFFGFFGLFGVPLFLAFLRYLHEEGFLHLPMLAPKEPTSASSPQPSAPEQSS